MAKATPDAVLDTPLAAIAAADRLYVCSGQPANFAGIAALTLATATLTPGDGNGDFTIAAGDVSGRKLTVAQQADVPITASGEANHIVLADAGSSELLQVTTCTPQTLTSGGTVTVPAYDVEFEGPT